MRPLASPSAILSTAFFFAYGRGWEDAIGGDSWWMILLYFVLSPLLFAVPTIGIAAVLQIPIEKYLRRSPEDGVEELLRRCRLEVESDLGYGPQVFETE